MSLFIYLNLRNLLYLTRLMRKKRKTAAAGFPSSVSFADSFSQEKPIARRGYPCLPPGEGGIRRLPQAG